MPFSATCLLRAASAALLFGVPFPASGSGDFANVDPRIEPMLHGVLRDAASRFGTAACAALLGDYSDSRTGRPLRETLERTGLGPEAWLASLAFVNGSGHSGCARRRTFAFTPVGSPFVVVCPATLERLRRSERDLVMTVLIHETLHSLGLGEDPPSSEEITLQVGNRCVR